jgi:hypothetical protein
MTPEQIAAIQEREYVAEAIIISKFGADIHHVKSVTLTGARNHQRLRRESE